VILTKWLLHVTVLLIYQLKLHYSGTKFTFCSFKSNFYLYGGPRLAFNLDKSFTYQLGINPAYPDQEALQ
jgi:hypothetical protein